MEQTVDIITESGTLSLDATILNTFQACARKCYYSFIQNIRSQSKAKALENGDLMHKMLEIYYTLQIDGNTFVDSPIFAELVSIGLLPPVDKDTPAYKIYSVKAGRYFASKMELELDDVEACIFQFQEYCEYFRHDKWQPLAVEEVASKLLYDSPDLRVVYNCKIDLVAQQGNIIAPFDHKTSKRREEPSSLSNQFIGYCYGLNMNHIVINKIGFQKTLSPKERFNRFILPISDARIEEWRLNTVFWCQKIKEAIETGFWPMNLTSCDKYSGCIFIPICESDPEARLYKIERDFEVGDSWDVGKGLELV
jgi:hypothetical protein